MSPWPIQLYRGLFARGSVTGEWITSMALKAYLASGRRGFLQASLQPATDASEVPPGYKYWVIHFHWIFFGNWGFVVYTHWGHKPKTPAKPFKPCQPSLRVSPSSLRGGQLFKGYKFFRSSITNYFLHWSCFHRIQSANHILTSQAYTMSAWFFTMTGFHKFYNWDEAGSCIHLSNQV